MPEQSAPQSPADYPTSWEADVVLRDGATAHLRPITPQDGAGLQRFHDAQSPESIYLRFFSAMPHLSERDVHRFTHVDHHDRVAFVVTLADDIVGVGRYERLDRATAEVAFNISDAHQGRGLGSVLLEHLAAAARENGIARFVAEVLPHNTKMLVVFQNAGYEVSSHLDDGVISLYFDLDPTERSLAVMEAREHRAEARSIQRLLQPRSVALFGASRRPATVGHQLLADFLRGGYTGRLVVVHPLARTVLGVPAVPRLADAQGEIDLAVIALPAEAVLGVVRQCAAAGVRGLVVLSAGFAETGPDGLARQRELVHLARSHGMRVVGPNSWGLINADPQVRLNLSLVPEMPQSGRLGVFCQSGGLSVAVLAAVRTRALGLSTFLSAGNRSDVSGNDCMQYWEEDEGTDVVAMYLESVGNPRKFSRIARRMNRRKPVIVLKSGTSGYGVPPGHAVRPSAAPREAFDSMLRQSGCIRVDTVDHLLDVAQLLVHQPLPRGPRVAIVGNSDALATLIADACLSWNLDVADPPVSVHPQAGAGQFRRALEQTFARSDIDAVVAAFIPPIGTQTHLVAMALSEVAGAHDVPVVSCFLAAESLTQALSGRRRRVPVYPTPEQAVRSLAAAVRYAQWRTREQGHRVEPAGMDLPAVRALVRSRLSEVPDSGVELTQEEVASVLACVGVDLWPQIPVSDVHEALSAAEALGYPVALKSDDPHLSHRQDLGGVRLNIDGPDGLREDLAQMQAQLPGDVVVQRMAEPGVACVVRAVEDPLFGPVVSFGLGGDASTLLGDVAHRIPPLTDVDVADLVRSVRAAPKLFGHHGARPADVRALEDLIARIACLADEVPELAALELNPVVVAEHGLAVLGARARLAAPAGRSDAGRRGLFSAG